MKTQFTLLNVLIGIFCLSIQSLAQNKWDYQWVIGYDTSLLDPGGDAILLDFRETPRSISHIKTVHNFWMEGSNTSMSDKDGNLLFYSNGCYIVNANHEVMLNGDTINPGVMWNEFCRKKAGSPIRQGVIALPAPGHDSLYYVFNLDYGLPYHFQGSPFLAIAPQRLYYQVIDMAQDAGYGAVAQKNQVAVADTFARSSLQAARHANGRDWWVVVPKSHSNCYFVVPVTDEGVQAPQLKCLGHVWDDFDSGTQVTFSPDGKKYVRFNGWNGLNIFDFDAATGELSSPLNIMFPNDTINYIMGAAISSNSQFLYICARKNLYQFDLRAPDIEASKIKIATWDGYSNPYPTIFYLAALAPDGKIYISNTSSTYNLHVIHKPNCPGLSCEVEQHGIVLPSYNFATIPNMPHYRQSYLECDSSLIGSAELAKIGEKLTVFPNPAVDHFFLKPPEGVRIGAEVLDLMGRKMACAFSEYEGGLRFDVSNLPKGMYLVSVWREDGLGRAVQKLVIR